MRTDQIGIVLAGVGGDDSRLLFKFSHASCFTVDALITSFVIEYFCFCTFYILTFSFSSSIVSTMCGSSVSDSASRFSCVLFVPFRVNIYLRDYTRSFDEWRIQALPAPGDSRVICDARYGVYRDTPVCVWIKQ